MDEPSHLDAQGRARMVDVGDKPATRREALASGFVRMSAAAREAFAGNLNKKGDARAVAEIAGVMAAKRTSELIPLCHSLPLSSVTVEALLEAEGVRVQARAATTGQTGVEMEALTAVTVACLTVYDMLKAVDKSMTIEEVMLLEKTGGRSGAWRRG